MQRLLLLSLAGLGSVLVSAVTRVEGGTLLSRHDGPQYLSKEDTGSFSLFKRTPFPLPGGQTSREAIHTPENSSYEFEASHQEHQEEGQQPDGWATSAYEGQAANLQPPNSETAPGGSGSALQLPDVHQREVIPVRQRLATWKRLVQDLRQVPGVDQVFLDCKHDVGLGYIHFWDQPSEDGAIEWRLCLRSTFASEDEMEGNPGAKQVAKASRAGYAALRDGILAGAEERRPHGIDQLIHDLLQHEVSNWPRLHDPIYRFFQLEYETHLAKAEMIRDKREKMIKKNPKKDPVVLTASLMAKMETEAKKAWDIYYTLQLTYRNIYIEYMQTVTQINNVRYRKKEPKYLEVFTYGDDALVGKQPI